MITSRLAKLWRSLSRSKEYRDAFAAAQVNAGVSFQIRANRVSRGMTQEEFGALWGAKQSFVARMENPDLARPNLQTLQRIAQALDVALIVKFASFSELAGWVAQYGENGFAVASFADDAIPIARNQTDRSDAKMVQLTFSGFGSKRTSPMISVASGFDTTQVPKENVA